MDIVICLHAKDNEVLPWCIEGVRQHVEHSDIIVLSSEANRKLVQNLSARFVSEDDVLSLDGNRFRKTDFISSPRFGWYFQQILKLAAADLVSTDHYLVVDADTVFLKDLTFFDDKGRPFYCTSSEYHKPYFVEFENLLGFSAERKYSFISHHMVFNRHFVREMTMSFRGLTPWFMNIALLCKKNTPPKHDCLFSEYETYGHFLKRFHPDQMMIRTLKFDNIVFHPSPGLIKILERKYDFVSFHHYGFQLKAGNRLVRIKPILRMLHNFFIK